MIPNDTTKAIWENLYLVRMPSLDATSVDFLKAHGTYITGNKRIDQANVNSWLTTYINIAKMVELHKEGVTISVLNPGDTKRIYDSIEAHLLAWRSELEYGVNIGNAPVQDLMDMDRFANTVYHHAKYHITPEFIDSLFARRIQDRFKATPSKMLKPLLPDTPNDNTQMPDRSTQLSDFLKSRVFGNRRT